jgi:MFS family permease
MLHHITKREKVIVMLAVMSGLFLVALDQTIISTALGAIVKDFNSFSSLGFVVTAYMLTTTITTPIAGKLSDMYGRRLMLIAGVSIFKPDALKSSVFKDYI